MYFAGLAQRSLDCRFLFAGSHQGLANPRRAFGRFLCGGPGTRHRTARGAGLYVGHRRGRVSPCGCGSLPERSPPAGVDGGPARRHARSGSPADNRSGGIVWHRRTGFLRCRRTRGGTQPCDRTRPGSRRLGRSHDPIARPSPPQPGVCRTVAHRRSGAGYPAATAATCDARIEACG